MSDKLTRFAPVPGLLAVLLTAAAWTLPATAHEKTIVSSILPIHSLVAGVVDGVHEARLLLPASASPHGYSMRPSEARLLQNADVVVWVGPDLETFLERPLASPRANQRVVSLMNDFDLHLLPTREGGVWEAHDHGHGHGHGHGHSHGHDQGHSHGHDQGHSHGGHNHGHSHGHSHGHDQGHSHGGHNHGHSHGHSHGHDQGHSHGGHNHGHSHGHSHGHDQGHGHDSGHAHGFKDAHIWLSPENARRIVTNLADLFIEIDPEHKDRIEANRDGMLDRIQSVEQTIRATLAPVADQKFIVFHDAYQYFEAHFQLAAAGSITLDPSRAPGARRIQELRERIAADDIVCLFTEPQFRPGIAQTLVEGQNTRLGELDPLGSNIPANADAWFLLLQQLADDLATCLSPGA